MLLFLSGVAVAHAQRPTVYPPPEYYVAFAPYYEGEYRNALGAFREAARGGLRSTEGRWIDSICYHTMMGECFYQLGDLTHALEQYHAALELAVAHNGWMLRIQYPELIEPSSSSIRSSITWGVRAIPMARIPDRMLSLQGRLDNMDVLKRGGVAAAPEYYSVNVKEILRCIALALRHRREILGPVCPHDPVTNQLLNAFTRYQTEPNHWSQSWTTCLAGLAFYSAGKLEQAEAELKRSLLLGGQFDHDLTPTGLLELGNLAMDQGQNQAAGALYLEATLAGASYEQCDLLAEAFRGAVLAHVVSGQKGLYAALLPASAWAKRRSRALTAELSLSAAENCAAQGQMGQALKLLADTRQSVGNRDMQHGTLGARFNYQSALVQFSQGNLAGGTKDLASAMAFQKNSSRRLFQMGLADALYTHDAISQKAADTLFSEVLREPTASDWNTDPLETLGVVLTPHPAPLEHWFDIAVERKDAEKALEIADRIRRQRFYSTLALGGRLLALRWILEGPEAALSQTAKLQRQDILNRYPNFARLSTQAGELRQQLNALPLAPDDDDGAKQQRRLFEQLAEASTAQELILREIALRREPSEFVFPPLRTAKEIQQQIPAGQLVLAYLVTSRGLTAFALSREKYAAWPVDNSNEVGKALADLLKQMGLTEKRTGVTAAVLKEKAWRTTGAKLLSHLTKQMKADAWDKYEEVVFVPDGMLWYVPFEALPVGESAGDVSLISKVRVRSVPTVALANAVTVGHKPNARTAVIVGKMLPTADAQASADAFAVLKEVLPQATRFDGLPFPSGIFSAACDRLLVLSELDPNPRGLYGWSPTGVERGKAGSTLEDWFALPWQSPAEVILPSFHTLAETGLRKTSGGQELFFVTCGLMAAGARSVLVSRWPVGGQTTFQLMREYVQELPYSSAAEAWKRSVQLASGMPVDPEAEPRIDKSAWDERVKADHPFFWAGNLLVDTGSQPKADEAPQR
jgi:hypothetical protein